MLKRLSPQAVSIALSHLPSQQNLFLFFRGMVNQSGIVYFTTFFKAWVFIMHEICLSSRFSRGYFSSAADKKREEIEPLTNCMMRKKWNLR